MSGPASANEGAAKILVVEDDAMVREFAQALIEALGYEPCVAADGNAALCLLDTHTDISLILTDVGLPGGMDGPALAKEAQRRRPGLPVLFASGSVDSEGRSPLLPPGAQVLGKPYRKAELARTLREILGKN
ncbi:MAG: response regulator [Alphaproteobacteria bacterium]